MRELQFGVARARRRLRTFRHPIQPNTRHATHGHARKGFWDNTVLSPKISSQLVRVLVVYQLAQEVGGSKHERQYLPNDTRRGGQHLRMRAVSACAELRRAHRRHDDHYAPDLPCQADAVVLQARTIVPSLTLLVCGTLQRKQRGQDRTEAAKAGSQGWLARVY